MCVSGSVSACGGNRDLKGEKKAGRVEVKLWSRSLLTCSFTYRYLLLQSDHKLAGLSHDPMFPFLLCYSINRPSV